MGRDSGRLVAWRRRCALVTGGLLSMTFTVASRTGRRRPRRRARQSPRRPKLAQTGHVTFWDCPSKTTLLLVVVNTLTLHPGATLDVSFTVRNGGTASCNYTAPYAGVAPGPTPPP